MINPEAFEIELGRAVERCLRDAPVNLAESIRYSLLAPGKRIRPRLALASAKMLGLDRDVGLAVAIALEMVHCFTLIHDDLPSMDNDDFRRGRPSNHKRFGEAAALLAGDALLSMAFEVFSEALPKVAPLYFAEGLKRFCWAAGPRGVIGGQAAEMLLTPASQLADLQAMHAGKTGALFKAPILIPADFVGLPNQDEKLLSIENFASELGQAFQVADDLSDAEQDAGKPLNVLFFMSADDARNKTKTALNRSMQRLEHSWGKQGVELLEIAHQVIKSLKSK